MSERSPLLEMLILESKGFIGIPPKRIIEMCSGWGEDSCDDELEYRKYLEAYHDFLSIHDKYVVDNVHEFGVVMMFEDVDDLINDGHSYRDAVVKMIRNKFSFIKVPLAEPPYDLLSDDYKEALKHNKNYMDMFMFKGKIVHGIISLEIED